MSQSVIDYVADLHARNDRLARLLDDAGRHACCTDDLALHALVDECRADLAAMTPTKEDQ